MAHLEKQTEIAPLRKGERTIQKALDAAEQLFADQGYEGTTMRQIADGIGIREPSLYKHFPGKEAIYAAVLERGIKPLVDEIDGWLTSQLTLEELLKIPPRMVNLLAQHPNVARLLQRELIAPEINPIAEQWFQRLFSSSDQFRKSLKGDDLDKQTILFTIALTNVALGFFASASIYQMLAGDDLFDQDTIDQQGEVFAKIFKTFLIH